MILAAKFKSQKKHKQRGAWFTLLLFFWGGACSDQRPQIGFSYSGRTMGTSFTVKVGRLPDAVEKEGLKQKIDRRLVEINDVMSTYVNHSELSRLNENPSREWIPVSRELLAVISEAQRVSEKSKGAFDITVGPLVNLWGFGPGSGSENIPAESEIVATLAATGFEHLTLRQLPPAIKKTVSDLYLDLSAIAKGYGADQIAELLETEKIQDYLVEIGGEIRVRGTKRDASLWRVAIEKPQVDQRAVQRVIELSDIAMATSGNYRNYFAAEGQHYSHTIDPNTGYPVTHTLASVTVLSHTTMVADAMATAFMVLGPDKGFELAENENLAVLFIVKSENGFDEKATTAFQKLAGNDMTTFIISFMVMAIIMAGMAIGVIFGRNAIKGSCGGVNNGSCVCTKKCDKKKKLEAARNAG